MCIDKNKKVPHYKMIELPNSPTVKLLNNVSNEDIKADISDISILIKSYEELQKHQSRPQNETSENELLHQDQRLGNLIFDMIKKYKHVIQQKMNTSETELGRLQFLQLLQKILLDEEIERHPIKTEPVQQIKSEPGYSIPTFDDLKKESFIQPESANQNQIIDSLKHEKEMQLAKLELEYREKTTQEQEQAKTELLKQKAIESFQKLPEQEQQTQLQNIKKLDQLSKELVYSDRSLYALQVAMSDPSLSGKGKQELVKQFLIEDSKKSQSKRRWLDVATTMAKTGGIMFCMYYLNSIAEQSTKQSEQNTKQDEIKLQSEKVNIDQTKANIDLLTQQGKNQKELHEYEQSYSANFRTAADVTKTLASTAFNYSPVYLITGTFKSFFDNASKIWGKHPAPNSTN